MKNEYITRVWRGSDYEIQGSFELDQYELISRALLMLLRPRKFDHSIYRRKIRFNITVYEEKNV